MEIYQEIFVVEGVLENFTQMDLHVRRVLNWLAKEHLFAQDIILIVQRCT